MHHKYMLGSHGLSAFAKNTEVRLHSKSYRKSSKCHNLLTSWQFLGGVPVKKSPSKDCGRCPNNQDDIAPKRSTPFVGKCSNILFPFQKPDSIVLISNFKFQILNIKYSFKWNNNNSFSEAGQHSGRLPGSVQGSGAESSV